MGNAVVLPSAASTLTRGFGTPSSAKVGWEPDESPCLALCLVPFNTDVSVEDSATGLAIVSGSVVFGTIAFHVGKSHERLMGFIS